MPNEPEVTSKYCARCCLVVPVATQSQDSESVAVGECSGQAPGLHRPERVCAQCLWSRILLPGCSVSRRSSRLSADGAASETLRAPVNSVLNCFCRQVISTLDTYDTPQCGARRFANTEDNRDRTVRVHGGTSGLVRSARPKLASGPQYLRSAADHASKVGPLIETHNWMF